MKTILITGGAGFIGSAVVRLLLAQNTFNVINVDKLTYAGSLLSLPNAEKNKNYTFEKVDICNAAKISELFSNYQPDFVMHLAAESHVDRSIDGPAEFIQTNIVGTYTLLDAANKYWQTLPEAKKVAFKFHHISTDEVYGDLANTGLLFTERTAYDPSSPYSASKASSDHLVRAWHRTYGLPTLVTNCSNNYGPYHFPEKLIPLTILNALEGKKLPIYGDGSQIRDWLFVEDHAKALVKVVTEGEVGETYNIGGHNEKTNLEVVQLICTILDELKPIEIANRYSELVSEAQITSYRELITFVKDRPGHDLRYAIDASKINEQLNWQPLETFETGLRKTVQWFLNNLTWCQQVQKDCYNRQRLGSN